MSDVVIFPDKSPSAEVIYSGKREKRRGSASNSDQAPSDSDNQPAPASSDEPVIRTAPLSPHISFPIPPVPPHAQAKVSSTSVRPPVSLSPVTPSTARVKPVSTSAVAPQSPHGSVDDSASEVGTRPRQRKKEGDRIQFFNEDPFCSRLDPYNAFCTKCQNWIVLSPNRRYVMKNWITHRKSDCKVLPGQEDQDGTNVLKVEEPSQAKGVESKAPPPVFPVAQTSSVPSAAPVSTISFPLEPKEMTVGEAARLEREQQRKARLEADPLTAVVHEHEVQCKLCHSWIKLGTTARYSVSRWTDHRERRCRVKRQSASSTVNTSPDGLSPSDVGRRGSDVDPQSDVEPPSDIDDPMDPARNESSAIILKLRGDPQVLYYNGVEIKCRYCSIGHDAGQDLQTAYDWWQRHKQHCSPPQHQSRTSSFTFWLPSFLTSSDPAASSASDQPTQQAAQSTTWLAKLWPYGRSTGRNMSSEPSPDTSRSGAMLPHKRGREDDDEGDSKHNERATRPRYDSNTSTTSGGIWQRLSTSVAGLVDGMRAGYASAASSSTPMDEDVRSSG